MTPRFALVALCALAAGCSSNAPANREARAFAPADASAEQPDCFNTRAINGYSEVDRDTVRLRVGQHDYYDVDVTATCWDLEWNNSVALVTRGRSNLCVGPAFGDGRIVTRDDSCTVVSIAHSPRAPAEEIEMTPFTPEDG